MIRQDNYIIACENDHITQTVIFNLLNNNLFIYQHLLEQGYLKATNNNLLVFQFVGVINIGEQIICVLPKYCVSHSWSFYDAIGETVQVLKVLKKAGSSNSEVPDYANFANNIFLNQSELSLADSFIRDYLEYGIFKKNKDLLLINSYGDVDWNSTIENLYPIISNNRPIYNDCYNFSATTDDYHIVTELHKWVLKYYLTKYGLLLDYNFSFDNETINNLESLGTNSFLENVIRQELQITFTDREVSLLKKLRLFLNNGQNNALGNFTLYGTGYFHVIWEKVCGFIFNNKIEKFNKYIPYPEWFDINNNAIKKDSLKPDIISINEADNSLFFILDAKYYSVKYVYDPEYAVINNPGVSDVSKQLLYGVAFKEVPFDNKYNCFLFPRIQEIFFEVVGHVSFPIFDEKIYCIYLSSKRAYNAFINNKSIGNESLSNIAISIVNYDDKPKSE